MRTSRALINRLRRRSSISQPARIRLRRQNRMPSWRSSMSIPQGQQLLWSTYLGGIGTDAGTGVAIDTGAANVYVVGTTNSPDIGASVATLNNSAAYQRCLDTAVNPTLGSACPTITSPAPNDAFVARLTNPTNTVFHCPSIISLISEGPTTKPAWRSRWIRAVAHW